MFSWFQTASVSSKLNLSAFLTSVTLDVIKHFDESLNIPISRRSNEYEKYVEAYYLHDKDKSTLYRYINDKTLLETFNDCQILKEAVESGEFSDRSLEDWVWEYNYECGKN